MTLMNHIPSGPFRAVLFDLDGTLLDTLQDIAITMNTVLAGEGLPTHSMDEFRIMVGSGMRDLVTKALPEETRQAAAIEYHLGKMQERYADQWNEHSRPYDGIDRLLDAIDRLGLKKAILSNKPDHFTKICAEELLSRWHFDVVMGHHDGIVHKPDPSGALLVSQLLGVQPYSILYVGDSGIDMLTATASGMYPLGVLWGYRPASELTASGAVQIASSPDDIIDLLHSTAIC
jgi:phosphoglycolate phosphatase